MLKKLFGMKESKDVSIHSPLNGHVIKLEDVPDPVFSQKMLGDGIAIEPTSGELYSPVDGKVVQVFPTKHAIGLITDNGLEVLVHIGLETVQMKGEGFETHVKEGDKVKVGQPLISFSIPLIKEKAKSIITPIVITNGDKVERIALDGVEEAVAKDTIIMRVTLK